MSDFSGARNLSASIALIESAIGQSTREGRDPTVQRIQLAQLLKDSGNYEGARNQLESAISTKRMDSQLQLQMAELEIAMFDTVNAWRRLNRALILTPDDPGILIQCGHLARIEGDTVAAEEYFSRVVKLGYPSGEAFYGLALVAPKNCNPVEIGKLYSEAPPSEKVALGFALGRILDKRGEFEESFRYTAEANKYQRRQLSDAGFIIDNREQQAFFDRHRIHLGEDLISRCRHDCLKTDKPIFILGLPRSGTSLVEQILASHSKVFGGGEVDISRLFEETCQSKTHRPFPLDIDKLQASELQSATRLYVERLAMLSPQSRRITDKLPHNFLRIGWLLAMLPNASIVHCERDAKDTCLSIYQQWFNDAHGYATELESLGMYHGYYQELMAYWHQLMPGRIHRISYEELIRSPEKTTSALLDYCNLNFEDACLKPHQTQRTVNTPSAEQVREPLYKNSVGRWRNYEVQLGALKEILDGGEK